MKHLTNLEYRKLLECISELYEYDDLSCLKQQLPAIVARLVPADLILLDEFNLRQQSAPVVYATYPEKVELHFEPEFNQLVYQDHPCIQHIKKTKCVQALKITDFMSARQYRQTRLYSEGLRLFEVEYNMGFQVVEPLLPEITSVSLVRKTRDFSESDRLKLNLLRTHVGRAYIHATQIAALCSKATSAFDALAATRQAVVVVNTNGSVNLCTDMAREYLAYYFESARGRYLPAKLYRWMREQETPGSPTGRITRPRRPFVTVRDGARLTIHHLSGSKAGQCLLVLEEHCPKRMVGSLQRHLGLTARRAEVLLWVAEGKTSQEIAIILGLSVSTVNKHTERIFEKLGVETRTAAALQAQQAMTRP